ILMAPGATLQIEGTLVARGTPECPIVFTSQSESPARGDWARVFFTPTHTGATVDANGAYVSGSILEHVEVLYSGGVGAGIVIEGARAPSLSHIRVAQSAGHGLDARGRHFTVRDSVFEDNAQNGMSGSQTPYNVPVLLRSVFRGNGGNGAQLGASCCGSTTSTVRDNVFDSNGSAGLWMEGNSGSGWDVAGNRFLSNGS